MKLSRVKIFEKYKGQWVAFKDDQVTVVGAGKTAKEALEQAKQKGYKLPILSFMAKDLDQVHI